MKEFLMTAIAFTGCLLLCFYTLGRKLKKPIEKPTRPELKPAEITDEQRTIDRSSDNSDLVRSNVELDLDSIDASNAGLRAKLDKLQ